jgi:hypothetical protein
MTSNQQYKEGTAQISKWFSSTHSITGKYQGQLWFKGQIKIEKLDGGSKIAIMDLDFQVYDENDRQTTITISYTKLIDDITNEGETPFEEIDKPEITNNKQPLTLTEAIWAIMDENSGKSLTMEINHGYGELNYEMANLTLNVGGHKISKLILNLENMTFTTSNKNIAAGEIRLYKSSLSFNFDIIFSIDGVDYLAGAISFLTGNLTLELPIQTGYNYVWYVLNY